MNRRSEPFADPIHGRNRPSRVDLVVAATSAPATALQKAAAEEAAVLAAADVVEKRVARDALLLDTQEDRDLSVDGERVRPVGVEPFPEAFEGGILPSETGQEVCHVVFSKGLWLWVLRLVRFHELDSDVSEWWQCFGADEEGVVGGSDAAEGANCFQDLSRVCCRYQRVEKCQKFRVMSNVVGILNEALKVFKRSWIGGVSNDTFPLQHVE